MYFRISTYRVLAATDDDFLAAAEALRDQMKAIPGLQGIRGVRLANGRHMSVVAYDSREAAVAARDTAGRIWDELGQHIDRDSFEQVEGEVVWEF